MISLKKAYADLSHHFTKRVKKQYILVLHRKLKTGETQMPTYDDINPANLYRSFQILETMISLSIFGPAARNH